MDSGRCGHMSAGDLLVAVNDVTVRHWSHEDVVNFLRRCRPRRVARFMLMTSRDQVRRVSAAATGRSASAMGSPLSPDGEPNSVDYNQLYRRLYSPVPLVRVDAPRTTHAKSADTRRGVTSNGDPDVVQSSRYSAPPIPDLVGGSPVPRRTDAGRRQEPRRSLPTQPVAYVDLLSPLTPRRTGRNLSQSSLNFSGTPDFIPASAYLEDSDRRRRATGRPSVDHELTSLPLEDQVFSSSTTNTPQLPTRRDDDCFQSLDADNASLPSSGSLRNERPVTSAVASGYQDRRAPAAFIGAGSESCNGYNARTAALHSAAQVRHHPPSEQHQRGQSNAAGPDKTTHRGTEVRLSTEGDSERPELVLTSKNGLRDIKRSVESSHIVEPIAPSSEQHTAPALSVSLSANVHLF